MGEKNQVMNTDQIKILEEQVNRWKEFDFDTALLSLNRALDFIQKNVYLPLIVHDLRQQMRRCAIK
jgi:hypothetical protein